MPAPATPPAVWKLRTRNLDLTRTPLLMGIVNVTPDSFSDGGRFSDTRRAVQQGLQLVEDGADLLDIGGESTRPGSQPVSPEEELQRTIPVIEQLAGQCPVPLSIDTSKARVARAALAAGAEIINDVTGLAGDPQMIGVARETAAGVCVMHMQGTPQTMQDNPRYDDVVADILAWLRRRRDELVAAGLDRSSICLDPGIGFGKSLTHNLQLLAAADRFQETGGPVLFGHSRKGFVRKITGDDSREQMAGTLAVSLHLARQGVHLIRVHDVRPTRQALAMHQALTDPEPAPGPDQTADTRKKTP